MEKRTQVKRKFRGMGLTGLFWRYLITTGCLVVLLCTVWLLLFNILVNMGFVLSAYTAVRGLQETEDMLKEQEIFDPEGIPHYYKWALVENGKIIESNMNQKQRKYAYSELGGNSAPHGWFYSQYFYPVPLQKDRVVLLEYDYSVCYGDPALEAVLPDFQTVYMMILLLLLLFLIALVTAHYTKILRKDTGAISAACETVRRRQLDAPLQEEVRVREFQAALTAIHTLRRELSHSLKQQWTDEQRKNETIAALTHDLKTPLTVIRGNAELLAEDHLTQTQKELAQAILRNADHAENYVGLLRKVTAGDGLASHQEEVSLCELFHDWVQLGRDLSAGKGQKITLDSSLPDLSGKKIEIEKSEVLRAMENLLSNGMRFTPAGGTILLGAALQSEHIGFWIQDEGPGFSSEALLKAGRTFYTEDGSRPKDGHMGMGLYFASQIAKKYGGYLSLENTKAGGRAFLWMKMN